MVDPQLMSYFQFDQADLDANRNGQFTDKQKTRIFTEDKSSRTWSRVGGFFLIFIGLIGLVAAIFAIANDSDLGFQIGFGLGFGCIWPLVWGGIGYFLVKNSFSKHEFKLAKVQGLVNIVRRESYSSESHTTTIYHELHIGGQEFSVQGTAADVLMQGDEYILYYISGSSEILSGELVQKAK